MKSPVNKSYIGIALTLIILTLIACGNITGENKPVAIKLDYQKILKAHHKDYFVNIDNTDDITVSIQIIDTIKEGLDKYNFPERNSLLKLLEKGELGEMQEIIIELTEKKLEDKRLASQLWFLNARIYEIDFLYITTENMKEKKVNAYQKINDFLPDNPDYNENVAKQFFANNDIEEAIYYSLKALDFISKNESDNILYKEQLVRLNNELGTYYSQKGENSSALEYLEQSLKLINDFQIKNSVLIVQTNILTSAIYYELGKYKTALGYATLAENNLEKLKIPGYWKSFTYNTLALLNEELATEKTEYYYNKTIDSGIYYYGNNHNELITYRSNYASYYLDCKIYDSAIFYYEKNIEIIKKNQTRLEHRLPKQYNYIGHTYSKMEMPEKAIEYYTKALTIQNEVGNFLTDDTINILINMALPLQKLEKYEEALQYNKTALEIALNIYSKAHPKIAFIYNRLGFSYELIDKTKSAIDYYDRAIAIYKKNNMENSDEIANVYFNKAQSLYYLEKYREAHSSLSLSYSIYNKIYGPAHPDTQKVKEGLTIVESSL